MLMYCRELLIRLERLFFRYISLRRMQRTKQDGFTLVELMVVVAVIAILAAIAMPQFMSAADKAKNAKQVADMQIIRNATQLYMIDKSLDTPPTVEKLYQEFKTVIGDRLLSASFDGNVEDASGNHNNGKIQGNP